MKLSDLDVKFLDCPNIDVLRPCQEKAVNAGLLSGKNLLVCTPTASGKTFVGVLASMNAVSKGKKAVYIVPLVALAYEKYREFSDYPVKVALSVGDLDSDNAYLERYDWIVCTAEKLDSLVRHRAKWLLDVGCVVIDEVHLLNDSSRGPTLEVLITLLRKLLPDAQFIGLSATVANSKEIADWLGANLVRDDWRPVPLKQLVFLDGSFFP